MASFMIAFAMYSKIPMPKTEWNEKNMKYAVCYFPMIGIVIGILEICCFWLCSFLGVGNLLRSVLMMAIPLWVTGGIHMDGYLDTVDARSSYGDREKKLVILKDPHAGAFAIMKGSLFLLLQVGLFTELSWNGTILLGSSFILSRALSGLALCMFKGARENGMLATFHKGADKKVVVASMLGYVAVMMVVLFGWAFFKGDLKIWGSTFGIVIVSFCCFLYYRFFSYREFGGITGDLAGYFLQLLELLILAVIVICEKGII